MVERRLAVITKKRLRRGVFCNVDDPVNAVIDDLEHRNQAPTRFAWSASVDSILAKLRVARA